MVSVVEVASGPLGSQRSWVCFQAEVILFFSFSLRFDAGTVTLGDKTLHLRSARTGHSANSLSLCDNKLKDIFKKICPCSRMNFFQTTSYICDLQLHDPMSCHWDLWPFVSQPFIHAPAAIFCPPFKTVQPPIHQVQYKSKLYF